MIRREVSNRANAQPAERTADVILDCEYTDGLLFLVMENIGVSSAYRVSVKFSEKIVGVGGEVTISTLKIFKAIQFLPPNKKIRIFLDTFQSYLARRQPTFFETRVTYYDRYDKRYTNLIKHDLSAYKEITEATQGTSHGNNDSVPSSGYRRDFPISG